jgi:hypothetical protein
MPAPAPPPGEQLVLTAARSLRQAWGSGAADPRQWDARLVSAISRLCALVDAIDGRPVVPPLDVPATASDYDRQAMIARGCDPEACRWPLGSHAPGCRAGGPVTLPMFGDGEL